MALNVIFGGIGHALAVPGYRYYFIGNLVSAIGRWAHRVGVGWLVWDLTHSEAWLGIVAFADLLPSLFVPIFGGVISDRVGSVLTIRVTSALGVAIAMVFAALTIADAITIEAIVILTALIGIVEAFAGPARISIAHTLVPRSVSSSAIAMNTASFNASRLIGPAIAGPIILFAGLATVFVLNAASYVAILALMFLIASDRPSRQGAPTRNLVREVKEGVAAIWQEPAIRFFLLLMAVSGLLIRPVIELLPGFAAGVFQGGPGTLSLLLSTLGFGAMVAGLWLARRGELVGITRLVVASYLLHALALVAFAATDVIWLGVVLIALMGFSLLVCNIGAQTMVQSVVAAQLRARVMSLYMVIAFGTPALGALVEGWLATVIGLQLTVASGAAVAALLWIWARRLQPAIARRLERST